MRKLILQFLLLFVIFQIFGAAAIVEAENDLGIETNMSFWWTLNEENQNSILQPGTNEPASDTASGFAVRQARLILDFENTETHFGMYSQVRLEVNVAILDLYGTWKPVRWFNVFMGQMKIPSTYEVLAKDNRLDFISRTTLSENITNWQLALTPYLSSFYGVRSYFRDAGIGFKGAFGPKSNVDLFHYFLMVSNGLGAGVYIGGPENKEFVYTNEFGDYFYGARLDVTPIKYLTIGGHYSINKHDRMLLRDEKTTLDLDRSSWSADLRFDLKYFYLAGMYAEGGIKEKYYLITMTEEGYRYDGWEVKALTRLWKQKLEIGARYDTYTFGQTAVENEITQSNWTLGANFKPAPSICIQLNYVIKETDNGVDPDLDDDVVLMNFQWNFRTNAR